MTRTCIPRDILFWIASFETPFQVIGHITGCQRFHADWRTCSHCRLNLISSMNCLSKKGGSKLKLGFGRRLPIRLAVLIIIVTYACTNTKYHTNNCWKINTYSSFKYVWYNLDGLLSIISVFLPNYCALGMNFFFSLVSVREYTLEIWCRDKWHIANNKKKYFFFLFLMCICKLYVSFDTKQDLIQMDSRLCFSK